VAEMGLFANYAIACARTSDSVPSDGWPRFLQIRCSTIAPNSHRLRTLLDESQRV
jgi:hypothetical protein